MWVTPRKQYLKFTPPRLLNIHTTEKINLFREETVVLMSRDDGRGHYADR